MALSAGDRLGSYEIVGPLGAGGMGEVYRAHDERLGRDVALKVLPAEFAADPQRLKRFEREARAMAALSHPNILAVHDVGRHDGVPYLVEELLEGESLEEVLTRGALEVHEATRIAAETAKGLAAAHEKGFVHRDLKPGNVFLTRDGTVKILDFGVAKRLPVVTPDAAETLTLETTASTADGRVLGTKAYMAPEQLRGRHIDRRADVFAFGVVLYEMLAGQRPFRRATLTDTVVAILETEPAPLPEAVPPALAAVVARCLVKDPERRYQRGSEVRAALEVVQSGSAVPGPSWLTPRRRRRALAAAAAALLAALTAVVGFDPGGVRSRLIGRAGPTAIKLAVLPFVNLSGDPDQEYLGDGLTQEMIAQLGRLRPDVLSVIARTSVMRYKKGDTPIDQIGRELGVDYVLEGSAQLEGGRLRIAAELIQVKDQTQRWADTFERDLSGVLTVQSEVARKVAESLALQLLPAEQARLTNIRAVNPEAYDAYLKGLFHLHKITPEHLETAREYFQLALEKEPDYALAYTGIAYVWLARGDWGLARPREAVPRAMTALSEALELDETLAEAHSLLAFVNYSYEWDWSAAEKEFRRAIELNPNYSDVRLFYSHYLTCMRRPEEARVQTARALELDPLSSFSQGMFGMTLFYLHRYDDAVAQLRKALRMEPDFSLAHQFLWFAFPEKKMFDEALAEAEKYFAVMGDSEVVEVMAGGYAAGGYTEAMRRAAENLATRARLTYVPPMDIAYLYGHAGEQDRALEWLERCYEERELDMVSLGANPLWDSLRHAPRFEALVRRVNLPAE